MNAHRFSIKCPGALQRWTIVEITFMDIMVLADKTVLGLVRDCNVISVNFLCYSMSRIREICSYEN